MFENDTGGFASADDIFAVLESIPAINDDRVERQYAREQMEREHHEPNRGLDGRGGPATSR